MKNFSLKVVGIMLSMMFSFPITAAEYVVQSGDTLTSVAEFTGHSVSQLVKMNDINDVDHIDVGQKLRWISSVDMRYASSWCAGQSIFGTSGEARYHYSLHHVYLIKKIVRYDDSPNGVPFDKIFEYMAKEIADTNQRLASKK